MNLRVAAPGQETTPGVEGAATPGRSRLRNVPFRAVAAGGAAAIAMIAGAIWIVAPASSVSTDDAYVKADSTIIAPKVQGLIAEILVRDNQWVRAGQPLIRIDPEDYVQAVDAAQADVEAASAGLAEQTSQKALASANTRAAAAAIRAADAERERALADRKRFDVLEASGDVSKSQADTARATATSADASAEKSRADFAASEQQVAVVDKSRAQLLAALAKAKAALSLARQNLTHTIVRAPVAGMIGDRQAQLGEYVGPGTKLMTIVPLDTIYVTANFKETQTGRMVVGQPAHITIDAVPERKIEGVVESLAPASGSEFSLLPFEPATGNFTRIVQRVPVRIRVLSGQSAIALLRPGLSADVTVDFTDRRRSE